MILRTLEEIRAYIVSVVLFLGHVGSGGCTEMRVMARGGRRIIRGYYDNAEALAENALEFDGEESVYLSLNPVKRDLLARSYNKLEDWAKIATSDAEIVCDSWLLIDADPNRPSGICSTEGELKEGLGVRDRVADWMQGEFGAKPVRGVSGNGGHALVRLPDYPPTPSTLDTKARLLKYLAERFSTAQVSVDTTVGNASRLTRCYGTVNVKGDNIPERPHRRSYLELEVEPPEPADIYPLVDKVCVNRTHFDVGAGGQGDGPPHGASKRTGRRHEQQGRKQGGSFDLVELLDDAGVPYRVTEQPDRTYYHFEHCPVHTDHDGHRYECCVMQFADGKLGGNCKHDDAVTWQDFKRVLLEIAGRPDRNDKPVPLGIAPMVQPDLFIVAADGVYEAEEDKDHRLIWTRITTRPVWPTDRVIDQEGKVWFKLKHDRGELMAQRDALMTTRKMKETLAARDLPVTDDTARSLVRFFSAFESTNLEVFSNAQVTTRLGYHGEEFIFPGLDTHIQFQALGPGEQMVVGALEERGSLDEWRKALQLLRPSWRAMIMVWSAAAAVWLRVLRHGNFFVHNYSDSSTGKTTVQKVAASVWGCPSEGASGLLQTWNTTVVGLEHRAHLMNDLPLFLSEYQTARREREVQSMIYTISEGRGRTRGRKEGGTRRELTWRTIAISTGEGSLAAAGNMKGAAMRVVELYGPPLQHLDGDQVRWLRSVAEENHGIVGRRIIKSLRENPGDVQMYAEDFRVWHERLAKIMPGRFGDRLAQYLAVIAVGGAYMHDAVIQDGLEPEEMAGLLEAAMRAEGEKDESYAERTLYLLESWVTERIGLFRDSADAGQVLGRFDQEGHLVILPTALKDACDDLGLDLKRVTKDFAELGWLDRSKDRLMKRARVAGRTPWCYVITTITHQADRLRVHPVFRRLEPRQQAN